MSPLTCTATDNLGNPPAWNLDNSGSRRGLAEALWSAVHKSAWFHTLSTVPSAVSPRPRSAYPVGLAQLENVHERVLHRRRGSLRR
jgi:hypothetical protein